MKSLFSKIKKIRDWSGLKLTLDFGSDGVHDVIVISAVQYIVGDCKDNDVLGEKWEHDIWMKCLCQDFNASPKDGDDVCLNTSL